MRGVVIVLVTLALTLSFAVGAVGQQEILLVDLRVEPDRMERSISLFDAAVANDFATFDTVYRETPQPEYAELHRLWTWSMNDPVGAFYNAATYDRLAATYPGFASYIDQYRIVDSNGNTFYPTAETRRFLLRQAVYGVIGRVDVAAAQAQPKPAAVAAVPQFAPVVAAAPQPQPVAVVADAAPAIEPVAPRAIEPAPIAIAPPRAAAETLAAEQARTVARRNEVSRGALSRSIFLIIAGLLGIGMMTVMLQTRRDEEPAKSTR